MVKQQCTNKVCSCGEISGEYAYYEQKIKEIRKNAYGFCYTERLDLADYCIGHGFDFEAFRLYRHVFLRLLPEIMSTGLSSFDSEFRRAFQGLTELCNSSEEYVREQSIKKVNGFKLWNERKKARMALNHSRLHAFEENFYETVSLKYESDYHLYDASVSFYSKSETWFPVLNFDSNRMVLPSSRFDVTFLTLSFLDSFGKWLEEGMPITIQLFSHGVSKPIFSIVEKIDMESFVDHAEEINLAPGVYYLYVPGMSAIGHISQFCHNTPDGVFFEFSVIKPRLKK